MEPDRMQKRFRSKRQAPYYKTSRALDTTIYPEILVIVDYDGYRLHGGDNVQVKRYFVSFWNGVDLRYRLLKGPRIRISIAGIIISRVSTFHRPVLCFQGILIYDIRHPDKDFLGLCAAAAARDCC